MELNGEQVSPEDIAPLALYNYGNFTTMLVDGLKVRGLKLHLERLDHDARALFGVGVDQKLVRSLVRQAAANIQHSIVVRVTVFCKDFELARPSNVDKVDILVTTRQAPLASRTALSLKPIPYQRDLAELKTSSVGGALYRRRLAQLEGFDDALFVDEAGEISEGPTWNIGFIKSGKVIFPKSPSLPGTSITLLQKVLERQSEPARLQPVRLQDLSDMEEVFVMSATNGLRPVKVIGDHLFVEHGNLNKLSKLYETIPYEQL